MPPGSQNFWNFYCVIWDYRQKTAKKKKMEKYISVTEIFFSQSFIFSWEIHRNSYLWAIRHIYQNQKFVFKLILLNIKFMKQNLKYILSSYIKAIIMASKLSKNKFSLYLYINWHVPLIIQSHE